jgi:hypothetical protein
VLKPPAFSLRVDNMKAKDTSKYPKERYIPVLLDSLQELFQEHGDRVTPTALAERMEQKLHRHISPFVAAYLYTTLGFVSSPRSNHMGRGYYIVRNPELLAERRAQFCKVNIDKSDKS